MDQDHNDEDDLEEGELKDDEDDLEEGELKDDDDDDDDGDGDGDDGNENKSDGEASRLKTSSSEEESPKRPASSPSPSSVSPASSSDSKEQSSSEDNRLSEDRYRTREREREDPSEKAAKLISMRTRLLEARSREIELKFQKNKGKFYSPPSPVLSPTINQKNLKMTVTKPSISYSENPNPPPFECQGPRTPPDNHVVTIDDKQIEWPSYLIKTTSTQPSITYSVNPNAKKVSKRKKSSLTSPIERKKHKVEAKNIPVASPPRKTVSPLALKYSYPRPHETDLNFDYRWYYDYFVNSLEMDHNQAEHQAYYSIISAGSYERETIDRWLISRGFSKQSSPNCDGQKLPTTPTLEEVISSRYESRHILSVKKEEADVPEQESGSAEVLNGIIDKGDGSTEKQHEKTEGLIGLRSLKPEITILKCQREIVLPDGQVLPPGTIQKIVHPYPKLDSELLGPYFDFF